MLIIRQPKTEYQVNPVGIGAAVPRLSWVLCSDRNNCMQHSYRILSYRDAECKDLLWDSGEVISEDSVAVGWKGPKLSSCQRVYWLVVVVDNDNEVASSELVFFEMGLLSSSDWRGAWIEPVEETDVDGRMPAPVLRKSFEIRKSLRCARIYQTAHGLYDFSINGKRGTEDRFMPGFTAYYQRIQAQTYDITHLLHPGTNLWQVMLGDGWWRGNTGGTYRNNFGYKLAFIGQIRLEFDDGSVEWICSDTDFLCSTGPIRKNDMKEGETYDNSFTFSEWQRVIPATSSYANKDLIIPSQSLPVREKEYFSPKIILTPKGETVLNFGQNIAGYVRMTLRNQQKGTTITLYHGETLDLEGNFTQKNIILENPDAEIQKITYICSGEKEETYQPTFAIFGFQYVKIEGLLGDIDPNDFTAIAVYSDMGDTGDFNCSNGLINKLVCNSRWSQKGNFMDVPTDCPTRERSPWSGDSHIYASTAARFMGVYPFFEKWLQDLPLEQFATGKVPNTIPISASLHNPIELERKKKKMESLPEGSIIKLALKMTLGTAENGGEIEGSAGWGDTSVITPYLMYLAYGDKSILENQYDSGKKWVDYMIKEAKKKSSVYADQPWYDNEDWCYVWDVDFHFGEWCEPDANSGDPMETMKLYYRPDYLTASMYLYSTTKLLSKIASILGKKEDEEGYAAYAEKVKEVYNKYFILSDGTIKAGRQAPNVRALAFDLANNEKRQAVLNNLVESIRKNDYHLNTGFLSTVHLLPVLADNGYADLAYRLLEQEDCPGWLYNVKAGATTILENWDGFVKCQNSFNHYSYGAVCEFLFSHCAGIQPMVEHPGYKEFILSPIPGGTLTYAYAEQKTGYGTIRSAWRKEENGMLRYDFTIPANTKAHVILPKGKEMILGSGNYTFIESEGNLC